MQVPSSTLNDVIGRLDSTKNHATFTKSEIKTTRDTDYRFKSHILYHNFYVFNDNSEAKTQRYVTRAIHETRGRKKLKKALCLPIY